METKCWLWPDHTISKRASRRLREEHNAVVDELQRMANWADNLARVLQNACPEAFDRTVALDADIAKARGEA